MIRCIPVDGSEPFDVGEHDLFERIENGERVIDHADRLAGHGTTFHWTPGFVGRRVECRIESWRERAERLEQELAISKAETALAEAAHRAALSSEGIGDMDLDEANAREKAALDQLEDLRRKIASDAMDERRLSEHG